MRQFGEPIPGAQYRPGAYAIIHDDERGLAVVQAGSLVLPGGGIDSGETVADAVVREVAEETGLTVVMTGHVGVVRQAIGRLNKEAHYVTCHIVAEGGPHEDDHELQWWRWEAAATQLRLEADRWAVETWAHAEGRRPLGSG